MGDTKAKVSRPLRLARYFLAGLVLLFTIIAGIQLMIFPMITIKFETGYGAQQLADLQVKKGSKVDLPIPLKPGSYFVGWSLTQNSSEVITNLNNVSSGTTLYAVWDGVEKYGVLMVDGTLYDQINIFDTRDVGISPEQLNERWLVLDDFTSPETDLQFLGNGVYCNPKNNFRKFLGWRYWNADNTENELLYDNGVWTWVQRDAEGNESVSEITDENKFYAPNYRTTFHAILQYREVILEYQLPNDVRVAKSTEPLACGETTVALLNSELQILGDADGINVNRFAYWQIVPRNFYDQYASAEIRELLSKTNTVFAAGETITLDPLWYYYGSDIKYSATAKNPVVKITVQGFNYADDAHDQYTMQLNTGTATSTDRVAIATTTADALSLEQPIIYDRLNRAFWLYQSPDIVNYSFYDYNGVYHEIATTEPEFAGNLRLIVGMETTVAGQKIFLNAARGINFQVNYRKANRNIRLEFDYGSGLTVLPNYTLQTGDITVAYTGRIGNQFTIVNAERYLKNDWLFYGWRLLDDADSDRIYAAGEIYTIPYLDTDVNTTLHFEAVWRMSRLLYDFDFAGGHWATEPDFSAMKGAYGNAVQIVKDVPVRFGYTFLGWYLNDDRETLLQPGDQLTISTVIQTLHAVWQEKRMNITFYTRVDNRGQWQPDALRDNIDHHVGDTIRLINMTDNAYYAFLGWQVGDTILPANTTLRFDTSVLLDLTCVDYGDRVEVSVYAAQERITLAVSYFIRYQDSNNQVVTEMITPRDGWVTALTPGDDEYFFRYAPFNLNNTREMQMRGSEFLGWDYEILRKDGSVAANGAISELTAVPAGFQQVRVYTRLQPKDYVVEYYDFEQRLLTVDTHSGSYYHYEDTIDLPSSSRVGVPASNASWGTFVGWSFEPDYASGNPDIVYDVLNNSTPRLQLSDRDEDYLTGDALNYAIYCDQHDVKVENTGKQYVIKLYAIYAQDFVQLAYQGLSTDPLMTCPVYVGNDYSKSVMGGTTVAPDSPDFIDRGLTVRDDQGWDRIAGANFVGWQITVDAGVNPVMKNYLENKLWFPGEALPAVDFGLNFLGRYVYYDRGNGTENLEIGNTVYRVRAVSPAALRNPLVISDVDVVALPYGDYTVTTGSITINSDQEVHVVVPADGNITLAPMAIKCDQVVDFYVGDNLTITGSPIYGANFQNYLVKKSYRLYDRTQPSSTQISDPLHHTEKYNYAATAQGLLLAKNGVLLGVPSHTALTTAELRAVFDKRIYGITRIANYALTEINSLTTIDLAKDNLWIDANALFSTYAQTIILPLNAAVMSDAGNVTCSVADECIAGWQYRLTRVRFGNADTTSSHYAFAADGFLYYGTTKEHVMYVLPSAVTTNLTYSPNDLRFADSVTKINPYALAARFLENTTWGRVDSITAENVGVNLTQLMGLPADLPRFVDRNNPFRGPMVQPYTKEVLFTCDDYRTVTLTYVYGEPFTVFNPKNNNPHNFIFDRPWYNFVGWTSDDGKIFYNVGEIYRVGVDTKMSGDGYTIIFDASRTESWQSYPIRFHYFDGKEDLEYKPDGMLDTRGIMHDMDEIYTTPNFDLTNLYLPGVDQTFIRDGVKYQFIGWGTKAVGSELSTRLWSNTAVKDRLLPDKSRASGAAQGWLNDGAYSYYALYDKVSDNIGYTLDLVNNSYSVKQNTNANPTKIYIPYAKYYDGYMVPVGKISDNAFSSLPNIDEIVIGGAVSEIGTSAFEGVDATVTFQHQGQYIQDNSASNLRQLTIGSRAFYRNAKLTSVYLPNSTVSIGDSAFEKCTALSAVLFMPEDGVSPILNRLGNTVFYDDTALSNTPIVTMIMEDQTGAKQRFYTVGDGIFANTNIRPVGSSQIVWLDTLLHVYNGSGQLTITENKVAGYAFTNLNDQATNNPVTSILFTNANTTIADNAFANLSSSVTEINLVMLNPRRVSTAAFNHVNHRLTVRVGDLARWQDVIRVVQTKNSNITFV